MSRAAAGCVGVPVCRHWLVNNSWICWFLSSSVTARLRQPPEPSEERGGWPRRFATVHCLAHTCTGGYHESPPDGRQLHWFISSQHHLENKLTDKQYSFTRIKEIELKYFQKFMMRTVRPVCPSLRCWWEMNRSQLSQKRRITLHLPPPLSWRLWLSPLRLPPVCRQQQRYNESKYFNYKLNFLAQDFMFYVCFNL